MVDYFQRSLELHREQRGKIELHSKVPVRNAEDLSVAYSPGVARPCEVIAKDPSEARQLTVKGNSVAVVTDGSAVLGLGNIGPQAALPVMEGKALLFKHYADVDAWPICLDTQDTEEIIRTVRLIAPGFGGVNLEDIAAPRCFEIEARLQDLGIPVFHDDQHGTAIVLLAALINAVRLTDRKLGDLKVVINGAGAAGTAIARLLRCVEYDPNLCTSVGEVVVCDSRGAIHAGRTDLNAEKRELLSYTNPRNKSGNIHDLLEGTDVFIGVSVGNLLTGADVKKMAEDPILFAMANPTPEILPNEALAAGAAVVGTGRSDFANQVNNVLAFPGIFRGALDSSAARITNNMKVAAAAALADAVVDPTRDRVLPAPTQEGLSAQVAIAVANAWQAESQA